MRILVTSDFHVDHQADKGVGLLRLLAPKAAGVDVLVAAGDLGQIEEMVRFLPLLCQMYPHVVYVAGNHEYYCTPREEVQCALIGVQRDHPNLHWLDNRAVQIGSQRFVGTTLWFPQTPSAEALASQFSDFKYIPALRKWVFQENKLAERFLHREVRSGDIVVTHHAPSSRSVPARYRGEPFNCFYRCDLDRLVGNGGARLWIHGHMHSPIRYELGETEVLCNPHGYPSRGEPEHFNQELIMEV